MANLFSCWALLMVSCSSSGGVDVDLDRYRRVLNDQPQAPEAAFAICASIGDASLASDCALVVASRAGASESSPSRWCGRVPKGAWRSECLFEAAEENLRRNEPERALVLCQQAGPFRRDCTLHIVTRDLDKLTVGMNAASMGERLPEASALYRRWSVSFAEDPDFSTRFWRGFYQAGLGSRADVDLTECEALPPENALLCHRAGAEIFIAALGPFLQMTGKLGVFCADPAPAAADVASWVGARPHPALATMLDERRSAICAEAVSG